MILNATDDELQLLSEALYALLAIKRRALADCDEMLADLEARDGRARARFAESDFAIPQIERLIGRIDTILTTEEQPT